MLRLGGIAVVQFPSEHHINRIRTARRSLGILEIILTDCLYVRHSTTLKNDIRDVDLGQSSY